MASERDVDRVLEEWGDRSFRRRRGGAEDDSTGGRLGLGGPVSRRAASGQGAGAAAGRLAAGQVRRAVRDVVRPGANQVVVKITGGARGFKAMAAHARYISRQGKEVAGGPGRTLDVVDERGERHEGAAAMRRLVEDWRTSGSYIPEHSHRKESFHIVFSMPKETRAQPLHEAVSASAARLFDGHRYAMVMHLDQGAPHVHVMVRAERIDGRRLNPRKADLDRWRATFARELQSRGIDAVATRQVVRLRNRAQPALWELRAGENGRLRRERAPVKDSPGAWSAREEALRAWRAVVGALAASPLSSDRALAVAAVNFLAREAANGRSRAEPRQPTRDESSMNRGDRDR